MQIFIGVYHINRFPIQLVTRGGVSNRSASLDPMAIQRPPSVGFLINQSTNCDVADPKFALGH